MVPFARHRQLRIGAGCVARGWSRREPGVILNSVVLVVSDFAPRESLVNDSNSSIPDFRRNDGLLPAIAQDAESGEVLMLAYMNAESYAETVRTGRAVYWSRSRGRLWRKGEESGHVQKVHQILVDCDADTILLKVTQQGAACHEGYRTCFFRQVTPGSVDVVAERMVDPARIYAPRPANDTDSSEAVVARPDAGAVLASEPSPHGGSS
jgi:phosphoribosyl-AMP cyclohydrolase